MKIPKVSQKSKQLKLNINPNELPDVKCSKCDNNTFVEARKIKKVSALISPDGVDQYLHIQTAICSQCGQEVPAKP